MSAAGAPAAAREHPSARGAGCGLASGWQELRSKVAAYLLVRHGLQGARLSGRPLPELVAAVYAREPGNAAFHLERLAFDWVRARQAQRGDPGAERLLAGPAGAALPEKSLILLHSGMGMALAELLLGRLGPRSRAAAFDAAVRRFVAASNEGSLPGYEAVSLEALGLIVRRFLPSLRRGVEGALRGLDPELAGYYWHGAGRAIYFLPSLFFPLPGNVRRGLDFCRREPPDAERRLDALSGFFFAVTMINLGHPVVLETYLRHLDESAGESAALASGAAACAITLHQTSPGHPALARFLDYRPSPAPGGTCRRALWERWVGTPCREAVETLYPLLRARRQLALLARHQSLPALRERLGPEGGGRPPSVSAPPEDQP
jgi:hypothetical protein